ncbi:MFS transporter [Peribacillus frigoritolerans]|uniref:MFS transporter n=1 Tax=Peribacillus frigoritolerans TaxID=450367 RepID=UPI00228273F4|nr:MFS transporter [Peribacillus frigoritolerans]MCY9002466.1 MFS transporter [Peribacillus frigoritolerans]
MYIPKARWYRICLTIFLVYLIQNIDRNNISMAIPSMIEQLNLSATVAGVLLSAFFWGYVITQTPGGMLAAKYTAKRVIVISCILVGSGAILTGMVTNYNALLFLRFFVGLAEGMVWPSLAILFVNWFPDNERAKAINLVQTGLPISAVILAPLSGWMISNWSYQFMFIAQGIPSIIIGLVFAFVVFDTPSKDKYLSKEEREFLEKNRSTTVKEEGSFKEVITNVRVWIFAFGWFLWVSGMYGFGLWLPSLIGQLSSQGIGTVGLLTAIPYAFSIVGMTFISSLSDKYTKSGQNRSWFVAIPLLLSGSALIIQQFTNGSSLFVSILLLVITAMGLYVTGPFWAWVMTCVPRNQSSAAVGLVNTVGNLGGIVGPIVVGIAAVGNDISSGFYILGISMVVSGLIFCTVARKFKIEVEAEAKEGSSESVVSN